ncbi:MAG: Fe-S cluster assembly protein SufB, partial [Acidimicrobiia bacterium]
MSEGIQALVQREYQYGFTTDLDTEIAPKGLTEDVVRLISAKNSEPEWLLEWRLGALRHFLTLEEPTWPNLHHEPIDYQGISYWAAPKTKGPAPESLDEIDPEMREMFDKLGISLAEQERLSGIAVDAIVDSVSVATTFKARLAEAGVIFCSFSEAVREHPELVRRHLGSVVG